MTIPSSQTFPAAASEDKSLVSRCIVLSSCAPRAASDQWILSETANVSVIGAYFATDVELPRDESVEYVLTFPPELTHAPSPWRVRFYGSVVRVEPPTAGRGPMA